MSMQVGNQSGLSPALSTQLQRVVSDGRIDGEELRELKQFAKQLKEVRDTTLWGLLVELMQDDTAKHIKILSFIRERADKAIT